MASVSDLVREGGERLAAAGVTSPRLDAELLLASVLGIDRTGLLTHGDAPVGEGSAAEYRAVLARRADGEPVAYLRGVREFMGLAFATDHRALIPRPETERLVELVELEVGRRLTAAPRPPGTPPIRVADIGTGSGAVAVALAVRLRSRRMLEHVDLLATDDAPEALDLARENAVGHAVGDGIRFAQADLLPRHEPPFDVLAANLPYVATADLDALAATLGREPRHALDGGSDGLRVIDRLVAILPAALAPHGVAFLEIGADQASALGALVEAVPGRWTCAVEADLAGLPRIARVER